MESIIEKIYYGKNMIEKPLNSREYETAMEFYDDIYQDLRDCLTEEQYKILSALLESHTMLENITEKQYFEQGFKMGIQLLLEALKEL
ncbi:MAG: hypothetical protein FWD71_10355 [Oscillospiraceae bacterium]|nr:hypothetical protein [Oscillospiraceae bacterium]